MRALSEEGPSDQVIHHRRRRIDAGIHALIEERWREKSSIARS
jgi:hypothetical protein